MRHAGLLFSMVSLLSLAACADSIPRGEPGDAAVPPADGGSVRPDAPDTCTLGCGPPPAGCRSVGARVDGPCELRTCGTWVCDDAGPPICAIDCAAPPPGCWFEGAVTEGPCDRLTCGTLVCEGPDAGPPDVCAIDCAAPPPGCRYEGSLTYGPCTEVTCGTLVCEDGGVPPPRDPRCPAAGGGGAPCCYRESNAARLLSPTFRVVGLSLDAPTGLANPAIESILQSSIDEDRLNWMIAVSQGMGAPDSILTGPADPLSAGPSARFGWVADDSARYDPIRVFPTYWDGDFIGSTSPAAGRSMVLPVGAGDGSTIMELPIAALSFSRLTMTDERTCIGSRAGRGWTFGAGFTGAVRVDEARLVRIEALMVDLCSLIAGASCASPPVGWSSRPDLLCTDAGCTAACDPAITCNAWRLSGQIAAAGTGM